MTRNHYFALDKITAMIISFSKNPIKQIYGIVFWNFRAILFFAVCAAAAYITLIEYKYDFVMLPPIPVSILGGALAIFLGFRNSSAYDRWWEARKIWGAVVNDSRSLGMESLAYPRVKDAGEEKEIAEWRRRLIMRHIGWLYALNGHLRKNPADISAYVSQDELEILSKKKNVPAQLLAIQGKEVDYGHRRGWYDEFRFVEMMGTLKKFYDDQGKAERIKNTVFPYYYNYFTLFFLWLLL